MNLNLTANGKAQELILAYLKENVSDILAKKINDGTPFTKDGKTLINKKTLDGFMKYANGEAKKLAEKGANAACIEDNVVYGWAIHYFEEDSIEGTLYNEDGTEYKPVVKTTAKSVTPITPPKPAPKPQMSIFDMMTCESAENSDNSSILPLQSQNTVKTKKQPEKVITPIICADKPKKQPSAFYQTYLQLVERHEGFLILLRLGDFYEAMNDHATTLASELDLTLTSRDVGLDERVPLAGIPFHAVHNYVDKLTERGYKVILAENLDTVTKYQADDEPNEIEELPVEEMRKFDSYVDDESEELPTVTKLIGDTPIEDNGVDYETFNEESTKSFDKETLCILSDLFDGEITLA